MSRQKERGIVGDKQRHRRLRLLIKKLNKERKKQAKKIDILCNDLIAPSVSQRISTSQSSGQST
jgi:hypothetical protein